MTSSVQFKHPQAGALASAGEPLRIIVCGNGATPLIENLAAAGRVRIVGNLVDDRDMLDKLANVEAADMAVLVASAGQQLRWQTRLMMLLGIDSLLLAGERNGAHAEYMTFARRLGVKHIAAVGAGDGDDEGEIVSRFVASVASAKGARPLRFIVAHRDGANGLAGTVVAGCVRRGDRVKTLPSGSESKVVRIVHGGREADIVNSGHPATLILEGGAAAGHADLVAAADAAPPVADQFQATVVWMSEEPLIPGRSYQLAIGGATAQCSITSLKYKIDVGSEEHLAAKQLALREIGVCNVAADRMIPCDPYAENPQTARFTLVEKPAGAIVGVGFIHFALRRAENIHWQALEVGRDARSLLKNQKASVLWFTGLSGAGKSTIANHVEKRLHALGCHTYVLDGDNVRHGLNKDLGFTEADRVENIRRVAEVSKLMADAGLIVLVSFISPFRAERQMARELFAPGEFYEIFIDTPLAEAERRDKKGLYKKARRGELKNFTGIDSPYESPAKPEARIDTTKVTAEEAAESIVRRLRDAGRLES